MFVVRKYADNHDALAKVIKEPEKDTSWLNICAETLVLTVVNIDARSKKTNYQCSIDLFS